MSNGMELQLVSNTQLDKMLRQHEGELDKWGNGNIKGDALIRYAMAEMSMSDDLRGCTPMSVYLALLACACTGLVPGKLRGHSYLVAFNNKKKDGDREITLREATFMMGWRGIKHIGFRSGIDLMSAVIHDNDVFDFDVGTSKFLTYKPALRNAGVVIGAAAWAELPGKRGLEVEYLDRQTLDNIKEAACRLRPSPAWNGKFRDQMERKSALKRIGKQTLEGEEFFKADAIENDQDEYGSAARSLDEFTDGAATRFVSKQSVEAATFGALPRPTQVQIPASGVTVTDSTGGPKPPAGKNAKAPAPGPKPVAAEPKPSANDQRPTPPTPDTSSAGSASPQASAATPAASSAPSSSTTPPPSIASAPVATVAPAAQPDHGDVASEPGPDEAFDASFFGDDPVDHAPRTPDQWMATFEACVATLSGREAVLAGIERWFPLFEGWLRACTTRADISSKMDVIKNWSAGSGLRSERRADPAKKIAYAAGDEITKKMAYAFSARWAELS